MALERENKNNQSILVDCNQGIFEKEQNMGNLDSEEELVIDLWGKWLFETHKTKTFEAYVSELIEITPPQQHAYFSFQHYRFVVVYRGKRFYGEYH